MKYPHLFSELQLGSLRLPNRVMMAAMSTGLADADGRITPAQVAYYRERARGGVGLVVVEFACVDRRFGISESTQVVLDTDEAVDGHAELVRVVKAEGAVPALQLQMPGQFAMEQDGLLRVAPSEVVSRGSGRVRARALEGDEVLQIVEAFRAAARRAIAAGYEAIELHGAHGYLLHAFMSPAMNRRDDEWGGDEDRRLALPRAVIEAVKAEAGGRPVLYRFSAEDYVPGSLTIEDMVRIAPKLVAAGADALDISTGSLAGSLERTIDPMSVEGWRFELAERIREATGVPVAAIGSRWPAAAESALAESKADLIALGRPLLADAFWAAAARRGEPESIRPCTSCNWCADRVFKHQPTGCAENPRTGRELVEPMARDAGGGRRLVVVGAGPGGLAAALQADSVGFEVTLLERAERVGGGLIASAAPPHKDNLDWYRTYLERRTHGSGVDVRLGTEASVDLIGELDPFAVIHAQGAVEHQPHVPGAGLPHVRSAYAMLQEADPRPDLWAGPALVYGGGETGCETAELLAKHGIDVTLVTRSSAEQLARAAEPLYRKVLLRRLAANPRVTILSETHLVRIEPDVVIVESAAGGATIPASMVVMAQGRRSDDGLHRALEARGIRSVLIGDSRDIGRIGDAVHDANAAIRDLVGGPREPAPA